jgi:hypothetical protein
MSSARLSLILLSGCSLGSAIELNEWAAEIGYRQDHASFDAGAILANGRQSGLGQTRYRHVQIGEIGLQGELGLTSRFIARGELKFGVIFHGDLQDSGLADWTSNPCNWQTAALYGLCNSCPCEPCRPWCEDYPLATLVPSQAKVRGTTWDLTLALGAVFVPCELWTLVPFAGYEFNQQRFRWRDSVWGPLSLAHMGSLCRNDSAEIHTTPCCEALLFEPCQTGCCSSLSDPFDCVGFANCFDGTVYRARWSTGLLGLELNWDPAPRWHLSGSYAFAYGHYSGLFTTEDASGISGSCGCCPTSTPSCADPAASIPMDWASASLHASLPAIGSELQLAADWGCCSNWLVGLQLGWNFRRALHCAALDPCASCLTVCDPLVLNRTHPIWRDAILRKARWMSFEVLFTAGYAF